MEIKDVQNNSFTVFDKGWALVTAGNKDKFNTMTISWGSMGTLWNKPIVTVYIKPVRYTHEFLMNNDYFTVSLYDEAYRKDLALLGSKSGRDCDKVAETSLHPKFLEKSVTFEEAKQTFVLKKIYVNKFVKEAVPAFAHDAYYTDEEEHYMFIGEVEEVL